MKTLLSATDAGNTRPRFAILGSCVSSDIFRIAPSLGELVLYRARSSLVSVMAPPLEFDENDIEYSSGFARHAIKADFEKTFFADLEAADCNTLIVDFVDERWDLLKVGSSWVTRSGDLVQSDLEARSGHTFTQVARMNPETHMLWRDACARFAERLRERFPSMRVVLHKVLGTDRYRDEQQVRELAPFADGKPLAAVNAMLEDYNSCFVAQLDSVLALDLPRTYLAEKGHRWGLGPFHFEDRYYVDAARFLAAR